jgi:hypothetical protein
MPPPRGRDPDTKKECPQCEAEFEYQERLGEEHIVSDDFSNSDVKWMDGDSFGQRYDQLDLKGLDLGYDGIAYKDEAIYKGEKIFIRQAGVGLSVAYEGDTVYCPQSVYIYKIRDDIGEMQNWYDDTDQWTDTDNIPAPDSIDRETYHKFLLGILNSRIFHYYVFKRFGEIDAAQAFAKLTQTKIRSLPIPVAKLTTDENSDKVAEIASCVEKLLNEDAELGDDTDWEIEQHLRDLYGLTGDDMIHISNQMGLVAYHQTMQELYPSGKPRTPERKAKISLDITAAEADD